MDVLCMSFSVNILVIMSFERYIMIKDPMRRQTITFHRSILKSGIALAVAIFLSSPMFMISEKITIQYDVTDSNDSPFPDGNYNSSANVANFLDINKHDKNMTLSENSQFSEDTPIIFDLNEHLLNDTFANSTRTVTLVRCVTGFSYQKMHKYYEIVIFLSIFCIPGALITTCYALLVRAFRQNNQSFSQSESNSTNRHARVRQIKKLSRTVFIIISCYMFCFLPFGTLRLIQFVHPIMLPAWVFYLFTSLTYINASVNPIFYTFLSEQYLKRMRSFGQKLRASVNELKRVICSAEIETPITPAAIRRTIQPATESVRLIRVSSKWFRKTIWVISP